MFNKKNLINIFKYIVFLEVITFSKLAFAEKESKDKSAPPQAAPETSNDPDSELAKELKPGEIFQCEADIYYEWEKTTEVNNKPEKDSKEPATNPTPPAVKKSKEFVETLVERGNDGKLCKSRLESRLTEAKNSAASTCKKIHNVSECKLQKISFSKTDLQILDFQAKRALLASIMENCEEKSGTCLEGSNSEIRCQIYRSPDSIPAKVEAPPAAAAPAKK